MKALFVDAHWKPKEGYPLSAQEISSRRALVGSKVWKDPTFEIRRTPAPAPDDNEVLIRVKSCGVCGSDTHLYETDGDGYILFSGLARFPCILGHEFSGVVEETGRRVANLKKGDLVAVESVMWCGLCRSCRAGAPNQCENVELLGLSVNGAIAEYAAINERYCWKIDGLMEAYPEEDIFDIGALIEPIGCAYNGIFVAGGGFLPGATVVVHGAGPIGLGAIALARVCGASLIIAFDVYDGRVEAARRMGADYAFNSRKLGGESPSDKVMELTRGAGAGVQVEAAGAAPLTIPEMERSMASQGRIIYLGRAAASTPMHLDRLVSGANRIVGARGHAGYGIFPNIISLISRGRLDPSPMISRRFPFDSAIEALKASVNRNECKVMVKL
ncbi:MAG: alcohol dehydrogenase catalytic domain-containing protein [Deltaproteobacteria bacterium]|nr:alcohol dehydrogenase catalytic domain-containing protein [Deltaproteobacteria bacterium]